MTVSVPFQRGRVILVRVELRHRTPCWRTMAVDTGSPLTVIPPGLAREIGLDVGEAPRVELKGVVGSAPAPKATIHSVSLLDQTVRNLAVVCHPLPPALGLHGILGLNFLEHFNIRIDNDSETISFEPRQR